MAPNLAELQHAQIRDMVLSSCPTAKIADAVGCSEHSVFAIKSHLRSFGSSKAPSNSVRQPRSITPPTLEAQWNTCLLDEFKTHVTPSSTL